MTLSIRGYSRLLETLYAATLDESEWRNFLVELCGATSSVNAFLIRSDSTRGRQVLASGGEEPPPDFDRGYMTTDPVGEAFLRRPRTGVIEVEDFLPRRHLVRTAYYSFMAACGVTYGTLIVPRLSTRQFDLIGLWRGDDRVRLEPHSSELLQLLYPHIQSAIRIHQALGISKNRALGVEALLDKSPTASMMLGASGKLFYTNEAAKTLLACRDGVIEQGGHVRPSCNAHRSEFVSLVAEAACEHGRGGAIELQRSSGKLPLQVLVSPLPRLGIYPERRVLVLSSDPEHNPQFPDATLKKLYGLTSAETDLANGLLTGLSPEAIAVVRGVSLATVRSQIKSILAKTNTQRQVDLVRLLYSMPRTFESAGT